MLCRDLEEKVAIAEMMPSLHVLEEAFLHQLVAKVYRLVPRFDVFEV